MSAASRYVVSQQVASPRTIAAVHARVPMGSVPRIFRQYLDQVYAASRAGHVQLDGENVFLYTFSPDRPSEIDVAFGVGIRAPFSPVDSVQPTSLPVGEVATTTHWGNYAGLRAAHDAVISWCDANGRKRSGASWEVYGHWTEDESQLRTDIFYLLDGAR